MVDNVIEKSNILNTMKILSEPDEKIGLLEFRFFCLYLSRINARNPEKRTIKIKIEEFENIFGVSFHSTLFTRQLKKIATRQMRIIENNKNIIINLYSKFAWSIENPRELEITCNYDVMPYLFELQKNYTSYKIMNIVKLNSVQKIRLYEIMKQYEKIRKIKIDITDLQEMICSKVQEFRFFKRDILESAIKDINKYTDIQVSYEKNLSCRKVVALTFTVSKKDDTPNFLFDSIENIEKLVDNSLESLYYRCNEVYTMEQLEMLYNYVESSGAKLNVSIENYIYSMYCKIKIEGNKVNNLFKYTFTIIEKQINDYIFNIQSVQKEEQLKEKPKEKSSMDLEEWKKLAHTYPRRMSNEECFYVLDDFNNTIGFVFESDFDKIVDGTWRKLDNKFSDGHLSPESDFGRSLMSLKR